MNTKTLTVAGAMLLALSFQAQAEEEVHSSRAHIKAEHHEEGNLYVVAKGMLSLGEKKTEEATDTEKEAELEGDMGGGIGLDVGYRVGYGFALEFDFSYGQTNVTKKVAGEEDKSGSGQYMTFGIDLLYGYHLNESWVLFAKGGYEYEIEKITDLDIDLGSQGFAYGVGMEYAINSHYAVLVEYEGSTIESPRGPGIFGGISYTY